MTQNDDLERDLARWLGAEAVDAAPAGQFERLIDATRKQRPRPALVAGLGSAWVEGPAAPLRVSLLVVALTALLILALAAAAVYVGGLPRRLPALVVPAGSGLIAYASRGDVFVGDPATGETQPIVTGPEIDATPIFSPDGTRIAFQRGDETGASILVVRADGSDQRVVVPVGFSGRGLGYAWTPDSASLVVVHDSVPFQTPYFDGELSVVDASGVSEPRLLTPPLPIRPGGPYFDANAGVAPMFRPPDGSRILSEVENRFDVFDADLRNVARLSLEGAFDLDEPHSICCPAWSPDGSMILFELVRDDFGRFGQFVMNADGSDVRQLGPYGGTRGGQWAPDGSRIAVSRCSTDPARPGQVISIVDVVTGVERALAATSVQTKTEGRALTTTSPGESLCSWYSGPDGRNWDYEGWSWSPDGTSIVFLETHGERPKVVNVETGEMAELPWEADALPTWQRVLPTGPG